MSILGDIQRTIGKCNPFNLLFGHVTTSKNGVTLGPKKNALGNAYESGVDNFVANTTEKRSDGVMSTVERAALKANIFGVLGNITVSNKGITLGPKRNALGVARDDVIDGVVNFHGNMRGFVGKAILTSPADFVTVDKNGITVGPMKNGFGKLKESIIDFFK